MAWFLVKKSQLDLYNRYSTFFFQYATVFALTSYFLLRSLILSSPEAIPCYFGIYPPGQNVMGSISIAPFIKSSCSYVEVECKIDRYNLSLAL